jgi:translation initiation factor IF-3
MLGVMQTRDAQRMAQDQGLDLVEVSPNAEPPVCKIMDFGKFRYDEGMRRKEARKSQQKTQVKEIKFHPNCEENDIQIKLRKIREFLADGHKIKLTLRYRGRENAHKDIGFDLINRIIRELEPIAVCEQQPKLLGRLLGAMLSPRSQKGIAKPAAAKPAAKAGAEA